MKKYILLIVSSILILTGCSMLKEQPRDAVEKFLKNYKNNSSEVVEQLDNYLDSQSLEDDVRKDYKELYLRQYTNMKYKIKDQTIDGDQATVEVQITVFDYYKTDKDANDYFTANKADFVDDDGDVDFSKYFVYKVNKLLATSEMVDYTLTLNLNKNGDKWEIQPLTNDELMKLHGTYEY